MYKNSALFAFLLILTPVSTVLATPQAAKGCEAEHRDIEQRLNYARNHGNTQRASGLEKALSELDAHCTDEGLRAERQEKVREKEQKVERRRQELTKAQADGRTEKISKKQQKLSEAEGELTEAKGMLNK